MILRKALLSSKLQSIANPGLDGLLSAMVKPANLSRDTQDTENVDVMPGHIFKADGDHGVLVSRNQATVHIIDIRSSMVEFQLNEDIINGIRGGFGEKTLPTMLLYNEAGLKIFEEITYTDDYYLTNAEIEVLTNNATEIAARVPDGAVLVELGSGNLRKVNIILQALEAAQKRVDYFALDLSRSELERTFSKLPNGGFRYVRCFGLHGTYDDGQKWLQENEAVRDRPRFILWLGSSIGNFETTGAEAFLSEWRENVIRPGSTDRMLIAFDSCDDAEKVYWAYNDRQLVTERFILNGLVNANTILARDVFNVSDWEYFGEFDVVNGRHQASYLAKKDVTVELAEGPVVVKKGEKVRVERSYKFSALQTTAMFEGAGLSVGTSWGQPGGEYTLHLLYNPAANVSLVPTAYARSTYPSTGEWEELWHLWDLVTLQMVRKDQYLTKPIELRNPILFYLGHIPTFLDVQISKSTNSANTEPRHYTNIFQRGIDPDVDDPTRCHQHSDVPDTWPELNEIKGFQSRVRERVRSLYKSGLSSLSVRRALWLGFEHEVMHLETLLYMLLQHDLTISPAGVPVPDFRSQYLLDSTQNRAEDLWIDVPGRKLIFGSEDREEDGGHFGWDNERPAINASVESFQAFSRPITNGEYALYLEAKSSKDIPKSWTLDGRNANTDVLSNIDESIASPTAFKGIFVKTVFGPVPLTYAQHWPVMASYDELNGCAEWMGGRLPTREELQVIYEHFEFVKKDLEAKKLAAMIDAVNGHLSMHGVHITPPEAPALGEKDNKSVSDDLFAEMVGANVSFRHWHPTCVYGKVCGRGDGGAWEWTSTVLERWNGFKPMELYPEYTVDFFDNKHNVVLGASWATHSKIAGRRTFVNWYQRAYEFAWCTGRLVRDAPTGKSE
ncbi:hypothetical protein ABW20_dc0103915 [Dactylellina cionopaga]|nr:hypothetical protein ABW20_dc0103915 [Dactylellina cionopaga]